MGKNDNLLSEELVRKIRHHSMYKINETPRYRALVNDGEEFDQLPDENFTNRVGQGGNFNTMVGEQEDETIKPPPSLKDIPPIEDVEGTPEPPIPSYADDGDDGVSTPNVESNEITSEPKVDEIQNEIIKHNIEIMKGIQNELQNLNDMFNGLKSEIKTLNAEVEEVREPTNAEKLMKRSEVSYPYYFNLNDFWKDNWFDKKRNEAQEKGIRELPDGSFVADFDDLYKQSKIDISRSFNDMI